MPQGANILDVDLTNPENCIFIPVNCVGIMGKGLALDFKKMYPSLAAIYKTFCNLHELKTGDPSILSKSGEGSGSVVFFPTKNDWRNPSELNWIREGLIRLATQPSHTQWRKQTRNIHIPKLGCGLGGLEWTDVRKIIEQFADCMPEHEIYLYE
ncbi:MAG: macro domain-containing protein [Pseudanabaena sp. M34BS1SP1A06MG]|nr:macro domain-containing protein [Pseudanabaena sp. M34BS1SP1A06MG]